MAVSDVAASIAALGIALAPAFLKFADVPRSGDDVEVDETAVVQCITEDDAPIHARYLSTGTSDRLDKGDVVQVLSKRKEWRHIAYVGQEAAELGWVTTEYLEACPSKTKRATSDANPEKPKRKPGSKAASADTSEVEGSPHVMLGVPTDADPSDDFLVDHGIYVLSYNRKRLNPNWVSWRLTAADLGDEDRQNDFRPDDELPNDFERVTKADYNGAGFDRGHMCPSAHRTSTADNNSLTFLMTNMQPQLHTLNAGPWKSLETLERKLVDEGGKEVYVVAGGIFAKGAPTFGPGIAIPKKNFRITVVLEPNQHLEDVTDKTPIFSVELPNDPSVRGQKWTQHKAKISRIEADTGYDFLSALPDGLEKKIEDAEPRDP